MSSPEFLPENIRLAGRKGLNSVIMTDFLNNGVTQGLSAGLREMMWCSFSPSSISSGTAASFDTIRVSFGLLSGRLAAHPGRRHPPDTVIMLNCASRCERISCSWRDNVRRTIKARARHRLHVVDESFKAQTLAARKLFADNLPEDLQGAVEQFAQDN